MGASVTEAAVPVSGYTAVAPTSLTAFLNATNNVFVFYYTLNQYSITYTLNGGVNAVGNPATYTVEDTPLSVADPIKLGYGFQYWVITYANGLQVPLTGGVIPAGTTGDLTLTALWSFNPIQYTVIPQFNGGSVINPPTTYNVETAASFAINNPTLAGYVFDHWMIRFANRTLIPSWSSPGLPADTVGDFTLIAVWSDALYDIDYVLNGGYMDSGMVNRYGLTSTVAIPNANKTGYTFLYWTANFANGTTIPLVNGVVPQGSYGDLTLAAVWNPNPITYTIEYVLYGGTNAVGNPGLYNVDIVSMFGVSIAVPNRADFVFLGWTVQYSDGTPDVVVPVSSYSIPVGVTGTITLHAIWEPIP
jgi:uncharacterized repeat protein (TIGR02543 family)